MINSVIWQKSGVEFDRNIPRSEFERTYWSANNVNFCPLQMPQRQKGRFKGTIAILEVVEDCDYQPLPFLGGWQLCRVVDALHFGKMFPEVVRKHKEVFAIGSIGPVSGVADCDLRRFHPSLFVFTEDGDASVVLGIERLKERYGRPYIPKGAKILVAQPE